MEISERSWIGHSALLYSYLPWNIRQYIDGIDAFGLDTDRKRAIRLLFQPLLVLWALWSTDSIKKYILRARRDSNPKPSDP